MTLGSGVIHPHISHVDDVSLVPTFGDQVYVTHTCTKQTFTKRVRRCGMPTEALFPQKHGSSDLDSTVITVNAVDINDLRWATYAEDSERLSINATNQTVAPVPGTGGGSG